jgi:3-methylcrotonyl-CoA carboxylase beta subunit
MTVLGTRIDRASKEFLQNSAAMDVQLTDLAERLADIRLGGGETTRKRHTERGKLLPRARIEALLDKNADLFEFSLFAAHGVYEDPLPAAGLITGIGAISGRDCVIVANDATVKGGTYYPLTVEKHLRAQEIAIENRLPCVYLVDSGGAFISGASFTIRLGCRRRRFPRSPPCSAPAPRGAPIFRRCAKKASSSRARARSSLPDLRW